MLLTQTPELGPDASETEPAPGPRTGDRARTTERGQVAAEPLPRWTSEVVRVRWGVMDDHGQVTECPSEHDAREYQAGHGGDVASRTTTRYTFLPPARRSGVPGQPVNRKRARVSEQPAEVNV